jgi:hypothetical protein
MKAFLLIALVGMSFSQISYACDSGPDYCTDDPRIAGLLTKKKKDLSKEYPARLVALLDLGVQCVARINQEPSAFGFVFVKPNGDKEAFTWSQDNEDIAKNELKSGVIKRFWIVNSRRAFSCYGQPTYDNQADYNADDDVNTSLAIKCGDGGSC